MCVCIYIYIYTYIYITCMHAYMHAMHTTYIQ